MKKLGILTLVFQNYGTRLQSYALCKAIEKIQPEDFSFEVIDMEGIWSEKNDNKKKFLIKAFFKYGIHFFSFVRNRLRWKKENREINKIDHSEERRKRSEAFESLISKIPYTERKYTCEELRSGVLNRYSAILVGSDQVWNGNKVNCQDIYMLDHFDKKGLTYAASFGMTTIPTKQRNDYQRRIDNFSSLLIREEEGIKLCKSLERNDAKHVLDPTLLLHGSEYQDLISSEPLVQGDFILVYSLNRSYKIYSQASKLAKRNNCKMVVLKRSFCPPAISAYPDAEELYTVSPEGFLWLIKNAKCVITNSYHAMLFSINFNSRFYLYLDNCDEENSRMLTLARLCKLDKRVFWETGSLPATIQNIDYTETNQIIDARRKESLKLLKESIDSVV